MAIGPFATPRENVIGVRKAAWQSAVWPPWCVVSNTCRLTGGIGGKLQHLEVTERSPWATAARRRRHFCVSGVLHEVGTTRCPHPQMCAWPLQAFAGDVA